MRQMRRIGAPAPVLHVGELISERGDSTARKAVRNFFHERVPHAGSRSMREHVEAARFRGHQEESGYRHVLGDRDPELSH